MAGPENSQTSVQLPRWQSHKRVFADRIARIGPVATMPADGIDRWVLDCGAVVDVTPDLIARGSPKVGDYFVQYDDGYKSWSPAQAFEEGYTRVAG